MITVNIAGLPIGIDNRYEHVYLQSKDYITDEAPLFTVTVTDEDIAKEKAVSQTDFSAGYYESIASCRKIAERLPEFDAFLFHGCVIELNDRAYVFTAKSGVGKTTHTRLWLSEFGSEVSIINGDKPAIRIIDGVPYASGTPWRGKEGYGKNATKRIDGFVFLSRAEENRAYRIAPSDAVTRFMSQIYLPEGSVNNLSKTIRLADGVINSVKLVHLECNMNPEAAHVCRSSLS